MVNEDKLKSVVAYIAARTLPGKVKLFKLMYLADFTARAQLGRSITGDTYENFPMGPVPQTLWSRFEEITHACVDVQRVETGVIPEQQMRPRAGFQSSLDLDDRRVLDEIIAEFGTWTGNRLRDFTHQTIPYRATNSGDVVPYGMAGYLRYQRPSGEQLSQSRARPDVAAALSAIAAKRREIPF